MRGEEALKHCESLNKDVAMNKLIFETAVNIAKYGSCFWEQTFTPTFNIRIMPQLELLEPYIQNNVGDILSWRLNTPYGVKPIFKVPNEIVEFHWNRSTNSWPYGTSLLSGLDTEFQILTDLETNLNEYMKRTAYPKEILTVGDNTYIAQESDVTGVRGQFRNWDVGEVIVTNLPHNYTAGGTGDRRVQNLPETLNFVKDQITDGLMVPPISRQYNSTLASSKEMSDWAQANLIMPMQRLIEWEIQREVYRPYLLSMNYSVKLAPNILWEPPDADREKNAVYYSTLVGAGIMPPKIAARELGFEEEFLEWQREQQRLERERMEYQKLNPPQEQLGAKKWEVTEIS